MASAPPRRPAPRAAAAAPAARRPAAAPTRSSGYSGEEGRRRAEAVEAQNAAAREMRANSAGMPRRFFCPIGTTREVVVVDEAPNFFRFEHNIKGRSGRYDEFTSCIAEDANCPVCAANPDKLPYFAMYLTVIDLTPFTTREGVEVPWSKKLLVAKPMQAKKLNRIFDRQGTLRGAVLEMTRDGEKEAAIGDPTFVEFFDEDMLAQYVDSYETQDKKIVDVIGGEVFDYEALFPAQTEEMLSALVGGGGPATRASHERNIGTRASRGGDDWQDPPPASRSRPPARGAAPAPSRPAARPAPRRPAAEEPAYDDRDETLDVEGQEDPAPPARTARPAPRAAAAPARPAARPAPRAAAREPEPEYDAPADEAPQRSAPANLAQRRAALRGGR
jgi:hypothetical protein